MFLEFLNFLTQFDSNFNVSQYLTLRAILAMLMSLFLSLALGRFFINKLQTLQIAQVVRNNGPQSHFSKAGTPTMGGVLILFTFIVTVLIWGNWHNHYLWIVVVTALLFGGIGFLDDFLKISKKSSDGLSAKQKYSAQTLSAILIILWLINNPQHAISTDLLIPFFKDLTIPLGTFGLAFFSYFVIVGSSNAVNLTDGLDGLAIVPVVLILGALAIFSYIGGNYIFAQYLNMPFMPAVSEMFVVSAALIGAGLGFLWFNTYPADVFMGDVGSLALGAILAVIAIIVRQEILLFIMGGIFVAETLSVIIQVVWYKRTKTRIFLMAPLHHHFEQQGISEPKIIIRFWMVTLILVLIALTSIKIQ